MKLLNQKFALGLVLAASIGLGACASSSPTKKSSSGDEGRVYAAPASMQLDTTTEVLPVGGRHIVVATVRDAEGNPVAGACVEWMMVMGGVGAIVEVDASTDPACGGQCCGQAAVTATGSTTRVLDMGTPDTSDDLRIGPGQTWVGVASPVEGTGHLMAMAAGVRDWDNRHDSVAVQWRDARVTVPDCETMRVGDTKDFTVQVNRYSDGMPLENHVVNFRVVSGPQATLNGQGDMVSVRTDANGEATATLAQVSGAEGITEIEIQVIRPENTECCEPQVMLGTYFLACPWVAPSIDIMKSAPETAAVGEAFNYDIVVSNASTISARGATVVDALPEGIVYVSSQPAADVNGNTLTWTLGELPSGAERSMRVTVRGTHTGRFRNCAVVNAEGGALSDESCANTVLTAPAISLVKTGPAEVMACDPIRYEFTVSNNGDAPARNVRIIDELPSGLVSEAGGRNISMDIGTLGAGESRTVSAIARAERPGTYENCATATAEGGLTTDPTCVSTTVRQPALSVTKTGPDERFAGRPIEFEITVTNTGDGVARDTVLRDLVPAGTTFVSASDSGSDVAGEVVWNLGNLAPGATRTVSLTVRGDAPGRVVNNATATAYCADAASGSATTDVRGIPAILLEVVDTDYDPIEVGNNVVYTITVTNQGSSPGRSIKITSIIPDAMDFVSAVGPTNASVNGRNVTFEPLPTLAPKAQAVYRLTVLAREAADVRMQISLTSLQLGDRPVSETESTYIYQ
ncbi:MAG TPA: hypothetical protein VGC54_13715 [Planctomycetota bacterium]